MQQKNGKLISGPVIPASGNATFAKNDIVSVSDTTVEIQQSILSGGKTSKNKLSFIRKGDGWQFSE